MIFAHLPALQVVVPLIAAPLCVILRRGTWTWALAMLVSWASLAISVVLLGQVLDDGPLSYAFGGWEPPWGIEYRVDVLNAYVLLIVSVVGAVVLPFARRSVLEEIPESQHSLFYASFLLCLTGLLGVTITGTPSTSSSSSRSLRCRPMC